MKEVYCLFQIGKIKKLDYIKNTSRFKLREPVYPQKLLQTQRDLELRKLKISNLLKPIHFKLTPFLP